MVWNTRLTQPLIPTAGLTKKTGVTKDAIEEVDWGGWIVLGGVQKVRRGKESFGSG